MLYVATVHYRSPQWIEIQTRHLREQIAEPLQIWSSLEGIDPSYASHFDRVLEQKGSHAGKLNHLAMEIGEQADAEDLLMFLDGDAFPVADPMPLIREGLARAPLVAVRRAENVDEPQPHPCFCVCSVGTWRSLPGDWTAGPTWIGAHGKPTSDVGGNLLRRLELSGTPWVQVLRSNRRNLDPLYFGIYGEAIYHHGAGFRVSELSPVHRDTAPEPLPVPRLALARPVRALVNRRRWQRWERATRRRQEQQSRRMYERISAGGRDWLRELL
jgi:hypothetical protein